MTLNFDPEVADVLAQMGGTDAFQPPRDDVEGRRAFWEPILAASSAAQPFPEEVQMSDHYATADDGAQIQMRWYTKEGATPGPAVVYFHGGGYYGDLVTGWQALLGDAVGGADVPTTAAPARLGDATGLPPAYIEVGQLDLFRDEDTAYATKLSRDGVPVEFHLHPGVPHEFDSIAFDSDVARRAIADRVRVLKSI